MHNVLHFPYNLYGFMHFGVCLSIPIHNDECLYKLSGIVYEIDTIIFIQGVLLDSIMCYTLLCIMVYDYKLVMYKYTLKWAEMADFMHIYAI